MLRALHRMPATRQCLQCSYSAAAKSDYRLVMKEAHALAEQSDLPPQETAYTFGVPFETFTRKVSPPCFRVQYSVLPTTNPLCCMLCADTP